MANTHETLTGLFTDIADAIRVKTGGTADIVADNFPEEIAAIETCPEDALFLESVNVELPTSAKWRPLTYGNGIYVAIAYGSDIAAYSKDGVTWTQTTMPTAANWYSVAYGNGKFVAVAYNSSVAAYSEDGVTWTPSTLPASKNWRPVAYGNGKFVAVAYNSSVAAYSEDGVTWTQIALPTLDKWRHMTYGGGKFIVVTTSSDMALYSEDGITWNQTTMPASLDWYSVAYGNGKFVSIANESNVAAYSEDGITWTQSTLPVSSSWQSIAFGSEKFVVVASPNDISLYSEDGVTWNQSTMPTSQNWWAVIYGGGKFVTVASDSATILYSNDGIEWLDEASIIVDINYTDVTEETVQATGILDGELSDQDGKIAELQELLIGKAIPDAGGGAEVETTTATLIIGPTLGAEIITATVLENEEVSSFVKKNISTNYTTITIDKVIIGSLVHIKFLVSKAVPNTDLSGLELIYTGENTFVYKVTGKDASIEFYIGQ